MDRNEYIESLLPADKMLEAALQHIASAGLPAMSVRADLGRLLTILAAASSTRRALEIGTFGGYSAICIARGLPPNGQLTCLELKSEHAALAKANIHRAGLDEKVQIRVGDALHSLQQLKESDERFDFIFIDADKPNYPAYLDYAFALSRVGTLIIADNVLLRDRVLDATNDNPSPTAVRTFNRTLMADSRCISTILPVHDGFAIAYVKNPVSLP